MIDLNYSRILAVRRRAGCFHVLFTLTVLIAGLGLIVLAPTVVQAEDYFYTITGGTITITGYSGPGRAVTIPSTINNLPVTSIGERAFAFNGLTNVNIPNSVISIAFEAFAVCDSLTDVTIGNSVTNIGSQAFPGCTSLRAVTVDADNPAYSSVAGVVFNKSQTTLILYPGAKAGGYTIPSGVMSIGGFAFGDCSSLTNITIPNSVTNIGTQAFAGCSSLTSINIPSNVTSIGGDAFGSCTSLTNITIPNSVTYIDAEAFNYCPNLASVYFEGNAPNLGLMPAEPFTDNETVYYLPGTRGWGPIFSGRPTALWVLPNPLILNNGPSFGVQTNGFGFIISWATNIPVVVEASASLGNPIWSPVSTNTLSGGTFYFGDPQWANYPSRFYRVRSP